MKVRKAIINFKKKIKSFVDKKILKNKSKFTIKETIIFMLVTFSFGLFLGGLIMYGKAMLGKNASLYEFISTYDELVNSYYEDVDSNKLLESGISGMMRYLGDPYSTFMTKENADAFNDDVEGIYHGIGAEIKFDEKMENVFIGKVFENSPAEKANIKENDQLLKVNGELVKGKSLSEIANIVKGKDNTDVTITVLRDNNEIEITVTRGTVDNISVVGKIIEEKNRKVGYLAISVFANNTYNQFKKELVKLEKEGIDALIIDVRSNSGGYLTSVTDIISMFTKKGDVIYQLKTKDKTEIIKDTTDESREYPVVILTNSLSASASEVLTGAFKETYKACIIGTKTYGKGKVQKVRTLSNGSMIKYTYQEWLTPNGNYIDGVGIIPDIEEQYIYDEKEDNQLNRAVSEIVGK